MKKITETFLLTLLAIQTPHLLLANTYTFTNAGAIGREGPTQAQIDSNYSGTNLANSVTINTRGIQEWTVPVDGNYSIEALGASGGNGVIGGSGGTVLNLGSGAQIKGNFELSQGDVLKIIVGQSGKSQTNNGGGGGGGGGGSFVVKNGNALIVAGGGGGAGGRINQHGVDANITTSGNQSSDGTAAGGQSGQGGSGGGPTWGGGGGGGFLSNGGNGGSSATGGLSFSNGAVGGAASSLYPSIGGFGGGGGVGYSGGGGGGYSGGAGGSHNTFYPGGGGGGSYNTGTSQNNSIRNDSGHGKVIITLLQPVQYIFTNAGATGRQGPTQAQIDSNYSGTNLANSVTINTRGIQEWTVPVDGNYSIEVHGASGGDHLDYNNGGNGAIVTGKFNFSANEKLFILVGQKGANGNSTSRGNSSGGGGGTFVAKGSNLSSAAPVIIAGGGGGGGDFNYRGAGQDGRPTENGGSTITRSTAGQNGNGGTNGGSTGAGNGAGFTGNGASTDTDTNELPMSFNNGGKGGLPRSSGFAGGFGGGGHGRYGGGGGGGYSGGAKGDYNTNDASGGGGGGSYNIGYDQNNSLGTNTGHGKVIITILTPNNPGSSSPIITQGNSAISKVLNEDTSVTWTPSELNATDSDTNASSLAWSLVTAPSHGTAIVDGNGSSPSILSYLPNPNFNGSDSFSVQVSDGENNDSITINLSVNSVNDNPTIYSINGQTLSSALTAEIQVPENSLVTLDINASDSIEGDTLTFQKTAGADRDTFDLNSSTGILSLPYSPDFENPADADANNTYEIWFRANDSNGGFDEKRITIRVTNVVEDNDGDGIEDAYDPDDDNDGFSDITEIAYGSNPLDANSTANASPTDLNASSPLQIAENQTIGSIVGQLTATDPDAKDTLTFTLVGDANDNQHFTIETNGTLRSASVFDFESNSSFTIRIKVRDQHNVWIKKDFTVQITNIVEDFDGDGIEDANDPDDDNDGFSDTAELAYGSNPLDANSTANTAPTQLIADSNLSIIENSPIGSTIGTFSAQDIDSKTTLTYSLIEGNSSTQSQVFSLDPNGTLKSAIQFDYESNRTSYSITVRVADQFNASIQNTFAVYVLNDPSDDPKPPIESNQTTESVIDHNQTDHNQTTPPIIDQNQTDSNSTPVPIVDQNATPASENTQTIVVQPKPVTPVKSDANQTKTYWWTPLPETMEGWRTSPWFGSFRPFPSSWLYHTELGWMHATHGESGDLWLWNQEFGWLWTANGVFPHLFNHATANWIYFLKKQDGKAHYYDYTTESVK